MLVSSVARGQGGFFNQKGSQLELYLQQIAAYKVYADYLQKGYRTLDKGLTTIHEFKNGELDLHKAWFRSLASVNPAIAKDPKARAILRYQEELSTLADKTVRDVRGHLGDEETAYVKNVFSHLLDASAKDLDELQLVVSDGKVQMTDDERLRRIDRIYLDMQEKYAFARSFAADAGLLVRERQRQQAEITTEKQIYQLK